jgi:hypothetical protein
MSKVTKIRFIPNNYLIEEYPELQKYEKEIYKFMDLLHRQRWFNKYDRDSYIPLKKVYLRNIFTNIDELLKVLKKHHLVDIDLHFIRGVKSQGYRLLERYRRAKHKAILNEEKEIKIPMNEISIRVDSDLKKLDFTSYEREKGKLQTQWDIELSDIYNIGIKNTADNFGSRMHHTLTFVSKVWRTRAEYQGSTFIEVDIANAQPLMLAILLKERNINEDYIELCEQGRIYEYIMESLHLTRQQVKDQMINQFFYGKNNYISKVGEYFKLRFPKTHAFIIEAKKNDFKLLAAMLQKIEAKILIYTILPELQKIDSPVIPVHDSFMILPEYVEITKAIINNAFSKSGVKVVVK